MFVIFVFVWLFGGLARLQGKPLLALSRAPSLNAPHTHTHNTHTLLDAPCHHGAAPADRKRVLDRHRERLVERALGRGDRCVDRLHEL